MTAAEALAGQRVELFMRRGLDEDTAVGLAEKLKRRDADSDERRVCLECCNLQGEGGHCYAARMGWLHATPRNFTPVRDLLQRCDRFSWAELAPAAVLEIDPR